MEVEYFVNFVRLFSVFFFREEIIGNLCLVNFENFWSKETVFGDIFSLKDFKIAPVGLRQGQQRVRLGDFCAICLIS